MLLFPLVIALALGRRCGLAFSLPVSYGAGGGCGMGGKYYAIAPAVPVPAADVVFPLCRIRMAVWPE